MKKLLVVLLAVAMIACFASCTNTPAESSAPADESKPAESTPADESAPADESTPADESLVEDESSEEPKGDDPADIEWKTFRVTHFNITDPYSAEGGDIIFTDVDIMGAWQHHIAFAPVEGHPHSWEVVAVSYSSGDNGPVDVPEGGFVYTANQGNNWPQLIADNNVKGDGATGLWYDDENHLSLPDYTAAANDTFAFAGSLAVGDILTIRGLDLDTFEMPTSTPDKDYWDTEYVCTSEFCIGIVDFED